MKTIFNNISGLGQAIVLSGPSGAGKSTVCGELMKDNSSLQFSVSCTTRSPREGEEDGVHYHFMSKEAFAQAVEAGELLEYAEVHGNFYGTLKSEVRDRLLKGEDVLIDIDVQGMYLIREAAKADDLLSKACAYVFIAPPSYDELAKRLRGRATDSEEAVQRRLSNALGEMKAWRDYDHLIVNEEVERSAELLKNIISAGSLKTTLLEDENSWLSGVGENA